MKELIEIFSERYPPSYGRREVMLYRCYHLCQLLFPRWFCSGCNRFKLTIERRRQNTMYEDDESNYVTCCAECFEEIEAYWQERWDEYNSGRL